MPTATKQKLGPKQKSWLKALRSEEYDQTIEYLCELKSTEGDYAFCCLGIAEELRNPTKWGFSHDKTLEKTTELDIQNGVFVVYGTESTEIMRDSTVDYYGFFNNEGEVDCEHKDFDDLLDWMKKTKPKASGKFCRNKRASFAGMNDEGFTFKQIADAAEKFPHLFFRESR